MNLIKQDTREQLGKGRKQKKSNGGIKNEEDEEEEKNSHDKKNKKVKVAEEEAPIGYIHVRARRGQATDSHSLAERVLFLFFIFWWLLLIYTKTLSNTSSYLLDS